MSIFKTLCEAFKDSLDNTSVIISILAAEGYYDNSVAPTDYAFKYDATTSTILAKDVATAESIKRILTANNFDVSISDVLLSIRPARVDESQSMSFREVVDEIEFHGAKITTKGKVYYAELDGLKISFSNANGKVLYDGHTYSTTDFIDEITGSFIQVTNETYEFCSDGLNAIKPILETYNIKAVVTELPMKRYSVKLDSTNITVDIRELLSSLTYYPTSND